MKNLCTLFFYETNSFDPRKDVCSVDNNIGELLEINTQEEDTSKPLEFERPSKEEIGEIPQPGLKDDLSKD